VCRSKHVEQLINTGIINSSTRLHLVGYFCMICSMMHGSTHIKFIKESINILLDLECSFILSNKLRILFLNQIFFLKRNLRIL